MLREVWRSAGWPCRDGLEAELLAAGLLARVHDGAGRETVRVTDAGLGLIAATLQKNRAARDAHEALVERVAREMQRAGRVVWRGLSLRAPLAADEGSTAWAIAMPDVFSIRHTTVEDHVEPIVQEVKVRRADLLADLRHGAKRAAYLAISSQCWYVLKEGIGTTDDVPAECGVLIARVQGGAVALEVARPAPRRAHRLPFGTWMASRTRSRARVEACRAMPRVGWRHHPRGASRCAGGAEAARDARGRAVPRTRLPPASVSRPATGRAPSRVSTWR